MGTSSRSSLVLCAEVEYMVEEKSEIVLCGNTSVRTAAEKAMTSSDWAATSRVAKAGGAMPTGVKETT